MCRGFIRESLGDEHLREKGRQQGREESQAVVQAQPQQWMQADHWNPEAEMAL